MAWSTIRKATDEDFERLQDAARRFIERHAEDFPYLDCEDPDVAENCARALENELGSDAYEREERGRRLRPLWRRCIRRALRCSGAEGIAYGYVGREVGR